MTTPQSPAQPGKALRATRLSRLLALVPYFSARDGIAIETAAADLGLTPKQLTADLNQLFVCGLPGYYPDDLIDLEFSEGHVTVKFAAGMDRPLRLTTSEATPLLVALGALVDTPGLDRAATRRAIAKIEDAVGSRIAAIAPDDDDSEESTSPIYRAVRQAVTDRQVVKLRYYSATRDTVSDRTVDPIRLQTVDNHTYLEAWCRQAQGVRLFRFDRIEEAVALPEPSAPPAEAADSPQSVILSDDPSLPVAEILIDPDLLWVLDYYVIEPSEPVTQRADHDAPVRARITYGSRDWLIRFLLGFGGRIRLADDAATSDEVADSARRTLARYGRAYD